MLQSTMKYHLSWTDAPHRRKLEELVEGQLELRAVLDGKGEVPVFVIAQILPKRPHEATDNLQRDALRDGFVLDELAHFLQADTAP